LVIVIFPNTKLSIYSVFCFVFWFHVQFIRELRQIGERMTGKRDLTSFAHLTSSAASKAASRTTVSQAAVGAGSDSVAALFAPQSPTSISLLSSPKRGKAKKKIEDFDPNALDAQPSEFDLMSGKAIKDLEMQYAAAQAFGAGGNSSARSNAHNGSHKQASTNGPAIASETQSMSRRVPSAKSGARSLSGGGSKVAGSSHRSVSPQPSASNIASSASCSSGDDDGESIFSLSAKPSSPPQAATSICRLPPIRSARAQE
jgi:hypothetical protein